VSASLRLRPCCHCPRGPPLVPKRRHLGTQSSDVCPHNLIHTRIARVSQHGDCLQRLPPGWSRFMTCTRQFSAVTNMSFLFFVQQAAETRPLPTLATCEPVMPLPSRFSAYSAIWCTTNLSDIFRQRQRLAVQQQQQIQVNKNPNSVC